MTAPASPVELPQFPEIVSVPKALLIEVLETAINNSWYAESDCACSAADHQEYENERQKIATLRDYICKGD